VKPRIKLATSQTPGGGEMALFQHDRDFTIMVHGQELMNSRRHTSELALARLGCAHLAGHKAPTILIGGLGMGYTLRQTLDMLAPDARVVVGELCAEVVEWNHAYLGALNNYPLKDKRVTLEIGDVTALISRSRGVFDAILLDIDNGPNALTDPRNRYLYGHEGLQACRRALRKRGTLSVWSAEASKKFERALMKSGLHVRRYRVPAEKGGKARSCYIWVASEDPQVLPPGGGEPRLHTQNGAGGRRGQYRRK